MTLDIIMIIILSRLFQQLQRIYFLFFILITHKVISENT